MTKCEPKICTALRVPWFMKMVYCSEQGDLETRSSEMVGDSADPSLGVALRRAHLFIRSNSIRIKIV